MLSNWLNNELKLGEEVLILNYQIHFHCLIANNNIRCIILEIKNDRSKIVKILIFRSLFRECSRERERNISILTIFDLSFLISNTTLLILLFPIKLLARRSIFKFPLLFFKILLLSTCCIMFLLPKARNRNKWLLHFTQNQGSPFPLRYL